MARIFSVSEINFEIRELLEGRIGEIWIAGELSNYRRQSSGHHYFTLKDDRAQLACVMFAKAYSARANVALRDGMQVQAYGRLTVYEARGQYQLVVQLIQTRGQGLLQAKFEALKAKLSEEGLFAAERKRPLPGFPERVALVTSPTGAALQDMLQILERRCPWLRMLIYPVRVQGEGAAQEIVQAIRYLNREKERLHLDVLILSRGGGSLEDLWPFNEEVVARAIVASNLPVISAVGHEIDFTIADFVADLRAPTPSAAAELVAPDRTGLLTRLRGLENGLRRWMQQALQVRRLHLRELVAIASLREPERILREREQRVDSLEARLLQTKSVVFELRRGRLRHLQALLHAYQPQQIVAARRRELRERENRLGNSTQSVIPALRGKVSQLERMLQALGPGQTLGRGYSITTDAAGQIVRSAADLQPGAELNSQFCDGIARSTVTERTLGAGFSGTEGNPSPA